MERRVRLLSVKVPPMVPMVADDRLVKSVAAFTFKSPVISAGPSIVRSPIAPDPITTEPDIVEQPASGVASAWELIVRVA